MVSDHRARTWANGWLKFGPPLMVAFVLVLALGVITWEAKADNWTGAGQAAANQTRDWNIPDQLGFRSRPASQRSKQFSGHGSARRWHH